MDHYESLKWIPENRRKTERKTKIKVDSNDPNNLEHITFICPLYSWHIKDKRIFLINS